jgi:alkanesulfonate monooxygenase SsuD/methylene tetrahydromethanopterin reductase-like flavin-dependent oxidoreductase (luciferase family)
MRLGVVLAQPWPDDAAAVEALGFDLGWIDERSAPAPLVVAAAVAARTTGLRIAASISAGPHPVMLAEEAAVADLTSNGRLVLVLGSDEEELLAETVELLFHASAARPFRHEGARWTVPARLAEHELAEARTRVTPAPAQLEPTVWLSGDASPAVARASALAFVSELEQAPARWQAFAEALGLAAQRVRRPALVRVEAASDGSIDAARLCDSLARERESWGLDVAILALPVRLAAEARRRALHEIATRVRPRLQLDALPQGLEGHWADE